MLGLTEPEGFQAGKKPEQSQSWEQELSQPSFPGWGWSLVIVVTFSVCCASSPGKPTETWTTTSHVPAGGVCVCFGGGLEALQGPEHPQLPPRCSGAVMVGEEGAVLRLQAQGFCFEGAGSKVQTPARHRGSLGSPSPGLCRTLLCTRGWQGCGGGSAAAQGLPARLFPACQHGVPACASTECQPAPARRSRPCLGRRKWERTARQEQ